MSVETDQQTDDSLLQQYVLSRNQEAFAVLVQRYGPMVWGVCQRIVRHTQDAEDALQATFAVLARKARSIRRQRTIGAWLHQVARRIALRARANSNRRNTVMPAAATAPVVEPAVENTAVEHIEVLDDEIARLPTILRQPIILCYLEGLTNREAAERLGCPEGTVVSRLARGRERLRLGLTRRGVVLGGAAAMAALLAGVGNAAPLTHQMLQAAQACGRLPASGALTGSTLLTAGAALLAGDMLRSMALRSLATIVTSSLIGITVVVFLILGLRPLLGTPNNAQGQLRNQNGDNASFFLNGIWEGEDLEFVGGATPEEHAALSRDCRWVIVGQVIRFKWKDTTIFSSNFEVEGSAPPWAIDIRPTDLEINPGNQSLLGAFNQRPSILEVCTALPAGNRPTDVRVGLVAYPAGVAANVRNTSLKINGKSPDPADASISVGNIFEGDEVRVRVGLVGYSKLRRLNRSFELEELQGKWAVQHMEAGGADLQLDPQGRQGARFGDGEYSLYLVQDENVLEFKGTFTLDPTQPARFMEMRPSQDESFLCLYEVQGDTLKLAMAAPGAARPLAFKTEAGQMIMSSEFRRAKPGDTQPGPR